MCFGCLFAIFAAAFPRLALLFVWLFSSPNLVMRAFHDILIWPILGIIFLPFTTLIYVLVYNPAVGLTGWGWFLVVLGFLIDIGAFSGSAYTNRSRMPRYGSQ
jgi:hypothetical protein